MRVGLERRVVGCDPSATPSGLARGGSARWPCATLLGFLFLLEGPAAAQTVAVVGHTIPYAVETGALDNPGDSPAVVFAEAIRLEPAVPWMRIEIAAARLDEGSAIRVTSLADAASQTLDADRLREWGSGTALLNGTVVVVELLAGARTRGNYLRIDRLWVGDAGMAPPPEGICGGLDDRVPSSYPAVGRFVVFNPPGSPGLIQTCTATIVNSPSTGNDRCHVTAGHCFGVSGSLPSAAILQFNVPPSSSNCSLVMPLPSDQYPVNLATVLPNPPPTGSGDDYSVFRCFSNPTTGLTTFEAQGVALPLATSIPGPGTLLRMVGFGGDATDAVGAPGSSCDCVPSAGTGTRNSIQQTHSGPVCPGSAISSTLYYEINSCGGDSGAPLILDSTAEVVAINKVGVLCGPGFGACSLLSGPEAEGTRVTNAGLLSALTTCAGLGVAPNDECAQAVPVVLGVNGPYSNVNATTSDPAWSCGYAGSDIWFTYTPACAGPVIFSTCDYSTFDTAIEVFDGSCGALVSLGCNDDGALTICGMQSWVSVTFPTGGIPYFVRVGGFAGAQGVFRLKVYTIATALPNDACEEAWLVGVGTNPNPPGTFYSTVCATDSPVPSSCGLTDNDVWFAFDPFCSGVATFEICSTSSFAAGIEVYRGSCGSLTPIACGTCPGGGPLAVPILASETYRIRVGGPLLGTFQLVVSTCSGPPANEDCSGAIPLVHGPNGPFDVSTATVSAPSWPTACAAPPVVADAWFSHTATCNGAVTFGGTFPVVEVFGGPCGTTSLGCGSSVSIPVAAGTTYAVRGGAFVPGGGFTLTVTPSAPAAPNDECSASIAIVEGPNGPFSNACATISEPSWPCAGVGSDVWFSYTASRSGFVTFQTCGSALNTAIEVWSEIVPCLLVASPGCNDDACGTQSSLTVPVTRSRVYRVRVGGVGGAQGSFVLSVLPEAPTNDECASTIPISPGLNGPFSNFGSTPSAPSWPFLCNFGVFGTPDVWFRYRAPCSGTVAFDTCSGSTLPSTIEVFSGTCASLVSLACAGINTCPAPAPSVPSSRATVSLATNQLCFVRVSGFGLTPYGKFRIRATNSAAAPGSFSTVSTGCGTATLEAGGAPTPGGAIAFTMEGAVGFPFLLLGIPSLPVAVCPPASCSLGMPFPIVIIPGSGFSMVLPCGVPVAASVAVQGADVGFGVSGGCGSAPFGIPVTLTDTVNVTIG